MEELVDDYFDAGHQQPQPQSPFSSWSSSNRVQTSREGVDSSRNNNITVTELPPILHIHLMRTQFDRVDKKSFKSNAKVSIPKRLYLDQYLDSFHAGDGSRVKRVRLWKEERYQHHKVLDSLLEEKKSLDMETDHTPLVEENALGVNDATLAISDIPEATMSEPPTLDNAKYEPNDLEERKQGKPPKDL